MNTGEVATFQIKHIRFLLQQEWGPRILGAQLSNTLN